MDLESLATCAFLFEFLVTKACQFIALLAKSTFISHGNFDIQSTCAHPIGHKTSFLPNAEKETGALLCTPRDFGVKQNLIFSYPFSIALKVKERFVANLPGATWTFLFIKSFNFN